jgi:outer membrane receptor protein involved in Fe transport
MKKGTWLVILCLGLIAATALNAQVTRLSGTIKGIVSDNAGIVLPGVKVSAQSSALMGEIWSVTDDNGYYRLVNLPPGVYTITAELEGFKTAKRTDIKVEVGQTYTVQLTTEMTQVKEEITVTGTPPLVDLQSNKMTSVISNELLKNLPLSRDLTKMSAFIPGTVDNVLGPYSGMIHGGNTGATAYEIDGVNGESATTGGMQNSPQFESVEEIEISTGGLSAQVGATGGSFVSVVTKSGGNEFHGQAQFYYTAKDLNNVLFTDDELSAFGISKPDFAKYDWTGSASLGGPIIKDRLWFYGTLEYAKSEYALSFLPFSVGGVSYEAYSNPAKTLKPFFKLTGQINKDMRMFVMYNRSTTKNLANTGRNIAYEATQDSDYTLDAASAELNWTLGANSYVNVRGGFSGSYRETVAHSDVRDNVSNVDDYNGRQWGNVPGDEQYTTRKTPFTGSIRLTHYLDNVLGGNHEIGAGIEYLYQFDRLPVTRGNAQIHHWYDGNPYGNVARGYDRDAKGDSTIVFGVLPYNKGDATKDLRGYRVSGYLQDAWTINNRLTVNLGARYDWYWGGFGGGGSTGLGTDTLAYQLGQALIPDLGYNPYAEFSVQAIKKAMDFKSISPRVGVSYDLFGDGKTAIKASYGRYYEAMPVMWFHRIQSDIQAYYNFYWWDDNGNAIADSGDTFKPTNLYQFTKQDPEILKWGVAGKDAGKFELKAPYNNELIFSISHELAKNLSAKAQYVFHNTFRDHTMGNYSISTGQHLSSVEDAPGLWVAKQVTIPAYGDYPAYTTTLYYAKNGAFWDSVMWQQFTSPYSKRTYNGLELTIDKRYANGWALGGSLTISRTKSTEDTEWGELNPNNVNLFDISPLDVPVIATIYGSFQLPLGFIGSFIYRHEEGRPIDNSIWVYCGDDWTVANNIQPGDYQWAYCRMESLGTRRGPSYDNIDLRLEKEFKFKFGTLSVFADVFNLLGRRNLDYGYMPGGDYNSETGERNTNWNYGQVTGILSNTGIRTFKLSARVTF